MAQTNTRDAKGVTRAHNPAPSFPLGLPGSRRKNVKKHKSSKGKKAGKGRRNSAAVTQARAAAPFKAKSNPKKKGGKKGGRRRNPAARALRNPSSAVNFGIACLAAGVGNEAFNAVASRVLPASLSPYLRTGIKFGAALYLRNNRTVNRFTGGNAAGVALVIGALAAAELARPYISGALDSVTNFIPQLPAGQPAQQGAAGLVSVDPRFINPGMAGLVNANPNFIF